jgi:hypothetical protein
VLVLVLLLLLTWFVLTVLLAGFTLLVQGMLYTEPTEGVLWRAPVAGAALTLLLSVWLVLDYRHPTQYRELQGFSAEDDLEPFPELRIVNRDGKEEVFKLRRNSRGQLEYQLDGRPLPGRPNKLVAVAKDGHKYTFEGIRDDKGRFVPGPGGAAVYRCAETGWETDEVQLGFVKIYHRGRFWGNVLLNGVHLLAWFLCLWPLLRFQWPHALGMALAAWGVMTLFVVPPLLNRAEAVAAQRNPAPARTS